MLLDVLLAPFANEHVSSTVLSDNISSIGNFFKKLRP